MLVLTRRENDKVVFPHLGITVEILRIKGKAIRLGVDAPPAVKILRHELATGPPPPKLPSPALLPNPSDRLRALIDTATARLRELNEQLTADGGDDAELAVYNLVQELQAWDAALKQPTEPETPTKRRALIVDDNKNENTLLAGFLRCRGYEVETACNGSEAIQRLGTNPIPDFVLLDMNMPRFDGRWTIREIRRSDRYTDLRVFALSGIHPHEYGIECERDGIDHWFAKPVNPEQLVLQLDTLTTTDAVCA